MSNMMSEYVAKAAMEQVIKEAYRETFGEDIEFTEEEIEYGFKVSADLVQKGMELGNDHNNYDMFHALLIREAVSAAIMAYRQAKIIKELRGND